MKFRTETEPLRMQGSVTHTTPMLMLGSCFADSIARRLAMRLFPVISNPFGTLYNPASIAAVLDRVADCRPFAQDDFFFDPTSRLFHSYALHSSMSRPDADQATVNANMVLEASSRFLNKASWLTLTLGTSWVFEEADSQRIVANCHKQPASLFRRRFMPPEESAGRLIDAIRKVRLTNPRIGVMLTVSPVRHAADGQHGNTLSKAALHLATQQIVDTLDNCCYFPAFEAVCDDLRDYRFYASDMRHPSDAASDYVYELFERSTMDAATVAVAADALKLWMRANHRESANGAASSRTADLTRLAGQLLQRAPHLHDSIEQLLQYHHDS